MLGNSTQNEHSVVQNNIKIMHSHYDSVIKQNQIHHSAVPNNIGDIENDTKQYESHYHAVQIILKKPKMLGTVHIISLPETILGICNVLEKSTQNPFPTLPNTIKDMHGGMEQNQQYPAVSNNTGNTETVSLNIFYLPNK
jgi:hypothetical protein